MLKLCVLIAARRSNKDAAGKLKKHGGAVVQIRVSASETAKGLTQNNKTEETEVATAALAALAAEMLYIITIIAQHHGIFHYWWWN